MSEEQKSKDDSKLQGFEGKVLKILFFMTIAGIPIGSVVALIWATKQH
ncbi:MAG: hypothetical protein KC493_06790 [Bacteriovoracaceae bacterium]|nr:hypothetical protein [Bacteriovoracaceae bacterium]